MQMQSAVDNHHNHHHNQVVSLFAFVSASIDSNQQVEPAARETQIAISKILPEP